MYFAHDTTDAISLLNAIILSQISSLKNLGSSPISLWGDLKMVFVRRWSIGNVQVISLWYDRLFPNPNSFDVVSRTDHCDIELDISMFLVHLDLCSANNVDPSHDLNTVCFTGIRQNRWKVPSTARGDVREWRKNGIMPFWVTWNNDVDSIPSTKMHLPAYIKNICLRFVTKGGRGRNDIIIQTAVIKIIIHQNSIRMYVLY